jgi:predicted AlkP superfamily phosphohydrolase/phosphomutase
MKTLVIGLDGAVPELLLDDVLLKNERLANLRRLMDAGCYGRLESIVPPITVPAWMCMAASRDPGSLGVYGFRNRCDHSYDRLSIVNSKSIRDLAIWDQVAREGGKANILGVPPNYPPRKTSGVSVGCFMTPETDDRTFTHPESISDDIRRLVGNYPVDVPGFRTERKEWLLEQILTMSRKQFDVVRHLMRDTEWDYFQFVIIGLDRIQHGFWKHHDPQHRQHPGTSPFNDAIRDYYAQLDDEVGSLLELLDEETNVVVLSDHGAQRLDGGFCVNEFLLREGDLALHHYPDKPTRFDGLDVDWSRTRAWGEGGYYARIFMNVKGREPQGTIEPGNYEKVRDDLKARLEATVDEDGRPLGTLVFRPEEIYREVRNIAPDLIVHFGGLYWRSIGSVGYGELHVQENDTGPDDCNHSQFGAFVLAGPNCPLAGEIEGAHLMDIAPTLLELGGYDVPETMQGRSLLSRRVGSAPVLTIDDEEVVRQRLSGLGYV